MAEVLPSSFWNKKRVEAQSMDAIEGVTGEQAAGYQVDTGVAKAVASGEAPVAAR